MRVISDNRHFIFHPEDYNHVKQDDLFPAARWWARNATIMSSADPWKSHFAIVPIIALITPDVPTFASWLDVARRATGATRGSIYESCLQELRLQLPPWRDERALREHDAKWSQDLCRAQMLELLREIRNDSAVATPGLFKLE